MISIALLTRNGMATLPALLEAVAAQEIDGQVEIVAVDSGSTDGSAELLATRAHRLLAIDAAGFNHGTTRNLALEHCAGELVVLMVQDAVPASVGWLAALVAPFAADPTLAGVTARQLPRTDASRLTRWALERWVAAQDRPWTSAVESPEQWRSMSPVDRFLAAVFDNVCSCLRRSVWAEHPFRATAIAEDLEWGKDVLLAGHRLAYVPEAPVLHSHERSARYELARTYLVHRRLGELFGMRTVPTAVALARSVALTAREHLEVLRHGAGPEPDLRETARALALAVAWPLGQYLGGRAAATGRELLRPRGI